MVGGIAYGWGNLVGPTGEQLGWPTLGWRLLIIVGYLLLSLSVVGAAAFARFNPNDLTNDPFSALPIQILAWVQAPQEEFRALAAGAIIVLLALLLLMNAGAIYLRNRYEQKW